MTLHPKGPRESQLTPQDIKTIREHYSDKGSPATFFLSKGQGDVGAQLSVFCDKFQQLAPHITVKKNSDIPFEAPVMVVGRHRNIAFYALPTGKILPLFLEALDHTSASGTALSEDIERMLDDIDLPVGLKLFVAGQCPYCPQAIRTIQTLASKTAMIRLQIINVDLFREQAQTDQRGNILRLTDGSELPIRTRSAQWFRHPLPLPAAL